MHDDIRFQPGMAAKDPETGHVWRFVEDRPEHQDWACGDTILRVYPHQIDNADVIFGRLDAGHGSNASRKRAIAAGPDMSDFVTALAVDAIVARKRNQPAVEILRPGPGQRVVAVQGQDVLEEAFPQVVIVDLAPMASLAHPFLWIGVREDGTAVAREHDWPPRDG